MASTSSGVDSRENPFFSFSFSLSFFSPAIDDDDDDDDDIVDVVVRGTEEEEGDNGVEMEATWISAVHGRQKKKEKKKDKCCSKVKEGER